MKVLMLYRLRRAVFKGVTLYRLYCSYLRTIVEFCLAVYHSLLAKTQEDYLKGLLRKAIRICYGFNEPIANIMEENHIKTLKDRRLRRCDSFIRKAVANPRFRNSTGQEDHNNWETVAGSLRAGPHQ